MTALAVGALALAACGSSAASTTSTTTSSTSGSGGAAGFTAYRNCLSQHGVTLPSFAGGFDRGTGTGPHTFPGGGTTPPTSFPHTSFSTTPAMAAAAKACASLRPTGGFGGFGRNGASSATFSAYIACLTSHGVSIPAGSTGPAALSTIDRTSSTFVAANAACVSLLTKGGSSTTTSTTGAPAASTTSST